MFNWSLFICLVLVCIPGILVITLSTIKTVQRVARERMPADQEMPSRAVVALASALQTLVLMAIAAAVGTALAPRVGLGAPFFEALVAGEPLWPALAPRLLPAFATGIVGGLIFVAAYYLYFRPRLDTQTVRAMEDLRNALGIWGRVLYGGIAEEVLTRWGLMTLLVWLGTLLAGSPSPAVMWGAIVISGVLFGLGHAPGYLAAGCQRSPTFFAAMISLNLWASLIFGWLYWQYGLLAAMMAHALFHLVWWPFDLRHYRRLVAEPAN
jgi:membrane protease YdiL (CAAX protease family)